MTGAPGSGKSTLARDLARELRVPFLARDDVRGGLLFSAGAWSDRLERIPPGDEAVEMFLQLVEAMVARGISCVVEYVVRARRPEDLERLRAGADCLAIRTECDRPLDRFVERNLSDRVISNRAVLDAIGFESIEAQTEAALERMAQVERDMLEEFPEPLLVVDTTDGYRPDLDVIVEFATQRNVS